MNLLTLFVHLPLPTVLALLSGTVIPALSALATKAPTALTGLLTGLLSVAAGFVSQWAAHPDGFDWKAAAGTALVTWAWAAMVHSKVLSGTRLEATLHAAGVKDPFGTALDDLEPIELTEPTSKPDLVPAPLVTGTLAPVQRPMPGKHEA